MRSIRGGTFGWNIEIYSTPTNQFDWSVSCAYVIGERSEPLSDKLGGEIVLPRASLYGTIYTVESHSYEPPGNEGVHKSEMSVTLKSSTSLKILCCSLQFS